MHNVILVVVHAGCCSSETLVSNLQEDITYHYPSNPSYLVHVYDMFITSCRRYIISSTYDNIFFVVIHISYM